ncbi:hypothetical protein VP01_12890g1 [Puccinia sorghi]|uniref:Uncharacterized protein n=1 Tax=Puccinia sorghi TaxID=27349 RepID=A0A0L6VNH0_9BASI|nr:hypothetical protein VP01_12890g1 [Puccinia sorghi]
MPTSKKGFRAASPITSLSLPSKKANSNPSNSKNEDALRYKKKFTLKPSTPSALTLAQRSKRSTKIALVLNKEGQLHSEEPEGRGEEGLCLYCGGQHER